MTENSKYNLTIVIAYYNLIFFERTLESFAKQTDKQFYVIIGNDGSPEKPDAIIEKYRNFLSINYVNFDTNIGGKDLTLQWKRCLKYVETPYFLILGDDDSISENTVYEFNKQIENDSERYNVYRLGIKRIDGEGKDLSGIIVYKDKESSVDFIVRRAKNEVVSSLGEYIFSTNMYHKVGIVSYPKAFYSDNMMVLQISDFGLIKNIDNAFSCIRVSQYSFSGNSKNEIYMHRAASFFYYDLLFKYEQYFAKNDMKQFVLPILYGKKHKILPIGCCKMIAIIMKYQAFGIVMNMLTQKLKSYKYGKAK